MVRVIRIFFSILLLACCLTIWTAPCFGQQTYGNIEGAIYVRNYDGDTITVDLPGVHPLFGNNISVRLAGIDTPEKNGKCEREKMLAKEVKNVVAAALTGARKIVLADVARDKYFRINARILADDVDIDAMLIERGLAVPYDGRTKTHNWCAPK